MDIYSVSDDLVRALIKLRKIEVISKEFSDIETNHGKVKFIEELLDKYQQFSKLDLKIQMHNEKNDEKAQHFRQEGNKYFSLKNQDYYKALELYNKSICYSEKGSENLSIGYANRSAILFEWKLYEECLNNIKLAKDANYPERLRHKLDKREKDCLEIIQKQQQHEQLKSQSVETNDEHKAETIETNTNVDEKSFEFKLSYEQHPNVPFIADCLDMKASEEYGRYIYTKKDLYPGDLISIEEPYCSILLPSLRYTRCANCKKENFLTLIPCENCTSAMYCSEKCLNEAYNTFHMYECPIIDFLFELFNKIHLIALRVVLTTINLFDNIDYCIEFCQSEKNLNQNSFTLDYTNFTKKEHYRAIHGLVTNQDKRIIADLFQRAVIAATLKKYLVEYTKLKDILNTENYLNFFIDLLFQHLQTSSSNMHSVDLIDSKLIKDEQCFASAAYAFGSLLNHSCAPNIVRIYKNTKLLIFILRPIKANDILYDNYGYHYATHPKRIRQQNLELQYRFQCKCEACENNYPLYNELPQPKECPECIENDDFENLMKFNRKYAIENLQRYCEFLKNYSQKYFPCIQIGAVEESLKMALNILVDAIPLKLKYRS